MDLLAKGPFSERADAEASLDRILDAFMAEEASFLQRGDGTAPIVDIGHEALDPELAAPRWPRLGLQGRLGARGARRRRYLALPVADPGSQIGLGEAALVDWPIANNMTARRGPLRRPMRTKCAQEDIRSNSLSN